MSLQVNGQLQPLPDPPTLAALLQHLSPTAPFAVAHNGNFVPRATYDACDLQPGDQIDIVQPTAGG